MPGTLVKTPSLQLRLVTVDTSAFTFYDIESLSNVFSMVAYTPRPQGPDLLEVFYLVDDHSLVAQVDGAALARVIRAGNPGLPEFEIALRDLHTIGGNLRMAQLIGLSDADQVCNIDDTSSYPSDLRPVCDTDAGYDPMRHPFRVGYNSLNYDTSMLALYLSEVFSDVVTHRNRLAKARLQLETARTPAQRGDAEILVNQVVNQRPKFIPVTAASMREHNDALFSDQHIEYMPSYLGWDTPQGKIRRAMLQSGRHIDAARLNELQYKVSLKRLLGMLGHQIKESEKLGHDSVITTIDDLYELFAYNVADCLGLSQLFAHPTYSSAFDLKAGLLAQYCECVFDKRGKVRKDRLSIDASSAKFVGRILAPYGWLDDIETVSFLYPDIEVAKQRNVAQVNVLDECVRFFEQHVTPRRDSNPLQAQAHADFMQIVAYYREIEGKNFNSSDEYQDKFDLPVHALRDIPKKPNNLPYFYADGTPSSCFATFSTGGIHGAEADLAGFHQDLRAHQAVVRDIELARALYPDARTFIAEAKRQHNLLTLPDQTTVDKSLVLLGSDPAKVRYRKPKKDNPEQMAQLERAQAQVPNPADLLATQRPAEQALDVIIADSRCPGGQRVIHGKAVLAKTTASGAEYRDEPVGRAPELFTGKEDGSTKLHPNYARTSAALVTHEDFTSYYPNLLRNMAAFYNPELGEDRYATIFFQKEELGQQLKQPGLSPAERARLSTLRNGTKLILNAASGAGDASHKTPIRMNNRIISMRIIGQLFSWRIGQAQTLAGARIVSTNTDGLYSVLDQATNDRVLAEQAALIGVDIEPEPMFLISKDSNNRMELTAPGPGESLTESRIISASGGTLACHEGPRPDKSLAHPAVIDTALARYLQVTASRGEDALGEDFDDELGRTIMREALDLDDPVRTAKLFQNVIAASRGSITYPFATDPLGTDFEVDDNDLPKLVNPRPLQMVNRVFVVRPGTPGAVSLHNAGAWKVPPATQAKRLEGAPVPPADPIAAKILAHHGWAATSWMHAQNPKLTRIPDGQDVVRRKINSIDQSWSMVICNDDLAALPPAELRSILESLDLEIYTRMLAETFTNNWKNA